MAVTRLSKPYAFCWQTYHNKWKTKLQAVARPHRLAAVGETVELDGSLSHSFVDPASPLKYEWTLSDGTTAQGPKATTHYNKPGTYSEVLKVTDKTGRTDYDFTVVQVLDPAKPEQSPPTIHAAYFPTRDIKVGDPIQFIVRSYRIDRDRRVLNVGTSEMARRSWRSVPMATPRCSPKMVMRKRRTATKSRATIWFKYQEPTTEAKRPPHIW